MEYNEIYLGQRISSLRMAKGMTQEQLAAILCVSPAAVSKWERNLALPSVELLWMLADYFECTIDELVGRKEEKLKSVGVYDKEHLRLVAIADDLLKCSETSRQQGLLAMEQLITDFQGSSEFLPFAIRYILHAFTKQMPVEKVMALLNNYADTLPKEQLEGPMVVAALNDIVSGASLEMIKETIASYIGMNYWKKIVSDKAIQYRREEILAKYRNKGLYSPATDLLESFAEFGNFELQTILRNLENDVFIKAMCGASGAVVVAFLRNVSDRLLNFFSEDIDSWDGTEEEILSAQKQILEIRERCC